MIPKQQKIALMHLFRCDFTGESTELLPIVVDLRFGLYDLSDGRFERIIKSRKAGRSFVIRS